MSNSIPVIPVIPVATNRTLTNLLHAWRQGDGLAFDHLIDDAHAQLKRIAEVQVRGQHGMVTLAAGDLLNEAVIRVMESPPDFKNRAHFFAAMSITMRNILVDYARARLTDKRGGGLLNVTFTESAHGETSAALDLLSLDQALTQLEAIDERGSQVIQLTYFAGLSREEIAAVLGISIPTVDREFKFARSWIGDAMRADGKP